MKMFARLGFIFLIITNASFASADNLYSGNVTIYEDNVIGGDIHITANTVLENYGTIQGTIIFDGPYSLTVKNHNTIESGFVMANGATITQSVSSLDDAHLIDNAIGHTIAVINADMLDIADIIAISRNASEINIRDSVIFIDGSYTDIDVPISLNNSVGFMVDGTNLEQSCVLLTNITGNTSGAETINVDSMYRASVSLNGGALILNMERETNYSHVFDNSFGEYIDSLRDKNPNDRFVQQLDMAKNRKQLNRVVAKSARAHPILLSKPLQIFNAINDANIFNLDDAMSTIQPFYIYSDEFSGWGGHANISGKVHDNIWGRAGLFAGRLNYDGKIDKYDLTLYGGNVDVAYLNQDFYFGVHGILSYANFDDINVFRNGEIITNPHGVSGRVSADSGVVFNVYDDIKIVPFIGGIIDYANVSGDKDTDLNLRIGTESMITTIQDGNKYGVGLRAYMQSDGSIYAMLNSNMLSIADGVGGGFNVGILYSDSILSYKIALDVKVLF